MHIVRGYMKDTKEVLIRKSIEGLRVITREGVSEEGFRGILVDSLWSHSEKNAFNEAYWNGLF